MAVTTKKQFAATTNATTTVFSPVSIQLNNQDDLDVYVTLSGGTRVLQLRQSTGSTAQSSHPQVNNTDGLYFPAVSAGATLYNYQLSTDNNTITFNSALPQGAVVFCERRTRDADSSYTSFASGSTIRATDLNNSSTESNFTAQDGRNKALEIEGVLFDGDQPSTNFVTSSHIVDGSIVNADINASADIAGTKLADDSVTLAKLGGGALPTDITVASANIVNGTIVEADIANSAVTSNKIADNAVTTTEILNGAVTTAKLAADAIDGTKLADNAVDSEHYIDGSIDRVHLEADIIDSTKLADNAVNSEHYVDGSIDHVHLANDIIDGDNIQDDVVNSEHIAAGALDNEHYAAGSITSDKLNGATVVTNSEQSGYSVNDTSFFTTSAAEARYFNASTGETIKDGESFPDNDTTIATTAAINDRIIDLVDDVGGFVPIANETSFPNANPDVNNGTGTIVSISTLASNHTSSGSGVISISNGTVGNSTVTINGAANSTTYSAGYGLLVETTTTLNTYTFHRLVPKATEVTTVAGKATEIGRLGTAAAVEDLSILGTADVVSDLNTLGTADVVSDMNVLAVSDVISDMNTLAVSGVISDMDTVATNVTNVNNVGGSIANVNTTAGSIGNVNTVAGSIGNVNTVGAAISNVNTTATNIASVNTTASNITNVNNFTDKYQIASNNPSTDGGGNALAAGDLYFNTSANELKVYNGSSWQGGVTASGSFASTTGNTFTGDNRYNDNVKALFGTGSDLQIYHDGSNSYVLDNGTGDLRLQTQGGHVRINYGTDDMAVFQPSGFVKLYYNNSAKFETTSTGATVTGTLTATGFATNNGGVTLNGANYNAAWVRSANTMRFNDNAIAGFGNADDLKIYHNGTDNYISGTTNTNIRIATNNTNRWNFANDGHLRPEANQTYDIGSTVQQVKQAYAKEFIVLDDGYFKAGTSADLQIYHDGIHSHIREVGTGDLRLRSDKILLMNENSEEFFVGTSNGSVELYYDDSKKLETTSTGATITGKLLFDSSTEQTIKLADNRHIHFGDGADLKIYSDGSTVFYLGNDQRFRNLASDENFLTFAVNGAVTAFYDGSKKFETTSAGATVTGQLTCTSHINLGDGDEIKIGAGEDLLIYHNGTDSIIDSGTGNLKIIAPNDVEAIKVFNDGTVNIGANADNVKLRFGIGSDLQIYHDGSDSYINDTGTGHLNIVASQVNILNTAANEAIAKFIPDGQVELYYDNSKKFETNSSGSVFYNNMTGDTAGGILQLKGANSNAFAIGMTSGADSPSGSDNHLQFHHWNNSSWDKVFLVHRNYMNFPDLKYIAFGNSNDVIMYHESGNNIINVQYDQELRIQHSTDYMARFIAEGANRFYYDHSTKAETTSTGFMVNGHMDLVDNNRLRLGSSQDLQIYHDGSHSRIVDSGTGYLVLETSRLQVNNAAGNEEIISASENSSVQLFYDNSKKIETGSNGVTVTANSDIRFTNGAWTGNAVKIQHHDNVLYVGIGSNGIIWREDGTGRWKIDGSGHFSPEANNTYDIGSTSQRVRNIYTNDLHLSNEGSSNDVDQTWGNWTIQEGESDLFLKNNRSGKKYKFNLTEVS